MHVEAAPAPVPAPAHKARGQRWLRVCKGLAVPALVVVGVAVPLLLSRSRRR